MSDLHRLIDDTFSKATCDLIVQDAGGQGETVQAALAAIERHLAGVADDAAPGLVAIAGARATMTADNAAVALERVQEVWAAWRDGGSAPSDAAATPGATVTTVSGDRLDADRAALALDP